MIGTSTINLYARLEQNYYYYLVPRYLVPTYAVVKIEVSTYSLA